MSPLVGCRFSCPLVSLGFFPVGAGCAGVAGVVVRSRSRVGVAAAFIYIYINALMRPDADAHDAAATSPRKV